MKTLILSTATASLLSLAAFTTAQARDCTGFSNRASLYTSIGLTDPATFWSAVAAECEASNWAELDRSAVRENISTYADTTGYERPDRETVQAAATAAGVELPARRNGQNKGRGKRKGQ